MVHAVLFANMLKELANRREVSADCCPGCTKRTENKNNTSWMVKIKC